MVCTLVSNLSYATIAPLVPIELEEYHGVPEIWIGPIFAVYSIGVITMSPVRAKLEESCWSWRITNANCIAYGMIGMGISLASFGLIVYSSNTNFVIGTTLVTRFLQGTSSAFIQTSCYIIATNDYPSDTEQIVGLVEAMTGAGLLLGPVIGSALYAATDFETTFFILGGVMSTIGFAAKRYFPSDTTRSSPITDALQMVPSKTRPNDNLSVTAEDIDGREDEHEDKFIMAAKLPTVATTSSGSDASNPSPPPVAIVRALAIENNNDDRNEEEARNTGSNRTFQGGTKVKTNQSKAASTMGGVSVIQDARCFLALLSGTMCYFMNTVLEPILAQRLLHFELSVVQIGFFFALFSVFYIPTSISIQWIPKWIEQRIIISFSMLASSLAYFFVGPSHLFHFPQDSLLLIGIGWSVLGVTLAAYLVPILPELNKAALASLQQHDEEEGNDTELENRRRQVKALCSGIFNSFLGIGQIVAPLYGSSFTSWIGFQLTTDSVGLLGIGFFFVYFTCANVREAIQKTSSAALSSS